MLQDNIKSRNKISRQTHLVPPILWTTRLCPTVRMDFVKNIQQPVTDQQGNDLPVSAFLPYADGYTPPGSTAHERRNTAVELPVWKPENCIQCNRCSFVCPHAVIRPAVLTEEEAAKAPETMSKLPMVG